MKNSLFDAFDTEVSLYRSHLNKKIQNETKKILRDTYVKILNNNYVLEQLVLEKRQEKVNEILRDIVRFTSIQMNQNRFFAKEDYSNLYSIFKTYHLDVKKEEIGSFQTIDDVRVYLYDLAGIFCMPIDQVMENLAMWQKGEMEVGEYLCKLYEAGMTFQNDFEPVFRRPNLLNFSQYVECIAMKDIVLVHMEFRLNKNN